MREVARGKEKKIRDDKVGRELFRVVTDSLQEVA